MQPITSIHEQEHANGLRGTKPKEKSKEPLGKPNTSRAIKSFIRNRHSHNKAFHLLAQESQFQHSSFIAHQHEREPI